MLAKIKPGKYVVAVSGGVDSMVLLDVLAKQPDMELVVAHFEHGVREDSDQDRLLVEKAAASYAVPFVFERGHLGTGVSEARAREARYAFLRKVKEEQGADAIVTAHHQDDVIETAILNVIRGTGRKGLSSLRSTEEIIRPLLNIPKKKILMYAHEHNVTWHEDSTNLGDDYARNYIRHKVIPKLGDLGEEKFYAHIERVSELNPDIDNLLLQDVQAHSTADGLSRSWFALLPYGISCEVMAAWLRGAGIRGFDRGMIERLTVAAKVAQPGKMADINAEHLLKVGKVTLNISLRSTS
jgi:tRNA(Ile)-lysidine synthetase-like protein